MSRSKKNWDHLVNYEGNYDFGATIQKGDRGPTGARGPIGPSGPQGVRGPKGDVGEPANLWTWMGNVSGVAELPPAAPGTNGQVYLVDETGYFYVSNGDYSYYIITSFEHVKGNKGEPGIEFPPVDDSIYGRAAFEENGEIFGEWRRTIDPRGDEMTGRLTLPDLTVGPDDSSRSTIIMQGEFSHTLQAVEDEDMNVLWGSWSVPFLGLTQQVRPAEIAYGNNIWLAGGLNMRPGTPVVGERHLLRSTDGENWTNLEGPEPDLYRWDAIEYGGGRFLLAGINSINNTVWYQSFNGFDFTEVIAVNQPDQVQALKYASGRWVCTTRVQNTPIWISDDNGATWQLPQDVSALLSSGYQSDTLTKMASDGQGHWIAVDYRSNKMAYSLDNGLNWSLQDFDTYLTVADSISVSGITYGKGTWVVTIDQSQNVGDNSRFIYYSTDGFQWTGAIIPRVSGVSDVFCNEDFFLACNRQDDQPLLVSKDGIEWTGYEQPEVVSSSGWKKVIYGGDTWVLMNLSNSPSRPFAYLNIDTTTTRSGLYYDGDLVATESNLEPVFDRIRENTQAIQGLVSEAIGVLSGDTLPVSDASGDPHPEGTLFFYTRTSSLYIRHEGIWLKLTN
jgi:hypothetical protein